MGVAAAVGCERPEESLEVRRWIARQGPAELCAASRARQRLQVSWLDQGARLEVLWPTARPARIAARAAW